MDTFSQQPISPFQTVHVLDVAQLASPRMTAAARGELRALLRRLATSRMGQLLLRVAVDHRLVVRFAEGRELHRGTARAAGMYHAPSRTIVLDDQLPVDEQLVTLAHELQHFVDAMLGWQLGTIESEVRAQQSEAQVIRQLGLRASTWGLTAAGQVRHPEDIAAEVRRHPMYRSNVPETPRADGRVHPLLGAAEVLPPMVSTSTHARSSASLRVGALAPVQAPVAPQPIAMVPTGAVAQAARAALNQNTPTGFDPTPAGTSADGPAERFLGALDTHRLALGA